MLSRIMGGVIYGDLNCKGINPGTNEPTLALIDHLFIYYLLPVQSRGS